MKRRFLAFLLALTVCSMTGTITAVAYGGEETAEKSNAQVDGSEFVEV